MRYWKAARFPCLYCGEKNHNVDLNVKGVARLVLCRECLLLWRYRGEDMDALWKRFDQSLRGELDLLLKAAED